MLEGYFPHTHPATRHHPMWCTVHYLRVSLTLQLSLSDLEIRAFHSCQLYVCRIACHMFKHLSTCLWTCPIFMGFIETIQHVTKLAGMNTIKYVLLYKNRSAVNRSLTLWESSNRAYDTSFAARHDIHHYHHHHHRARLTMYNTNKSILIYRLVSIKVALKILFDGNETLSKTH